MGENLIGCRFGRLTVIDYAEKRNGRRAWLCHCDCRVERIVIGSNLLRGSSASCGCLQKELLSTRKRTHGGWANREPLYNIWLGIKKRCNSQTDVHYPDYGGRGIKVCDEWRNYESFRQWAYDNGYDPALTIDRIDVNGNYEPGNCRWASHKVQQNNRRSCKYYSYNSETHTIKEWAEIYGINYQTLYARLNSYGYSFEQAINIEKRQKFA